MCEQGCLLIIQSPGDKPHLGAVLDLLNGLGVELAGVGVEVGNVVVLVDAGEVTLVQGASMDIVDPLEVRVEVALLDTLLEGDDVGALDGGTDGSIAGGLLALLHLDGSGGGGEGSGQQGRGENGEGLEVDHGDDDDCR